MLPGILLLPGHSRDQNSSESIGRWEDIVMAFGRDSWQYYWYAEFRLDKEGSTLATACRLSIDQPRLPFTSTQTRHSQRTPVSRSIIQSVAISSCKVGTKSRCKGELSRARHHCRLQVREQLTIVQGVGVRKYRWAEAYLVVSCRQQRAIDLQRMQFVKATVDTVA